MHKLHYIKNPDFIKIEIRADVLYYYLPENSGCTVFDINIARLKKGSIIELIRSLHLVLLVCELSNQIEVQHYLRYVEGLWPSALLDGEPGSKSISSKANYKSLYKGEWL